MPYLSSVPAGPRACAWILLLLALLLPGCATGKPTLVVLVGGAGLSQLGELGENISAICPDADVIETGGWDGFRADLRQTVRAHPYSGVVLIGHSFGCRTIAEAAAGMRGIDMVVMIDPSWDDFAIPPTVPCCLWYQRASDAGPERRSNLLNAGRPTIISGDHNDICHSPQIIAQVTQTVRAISERHATQQRLRNMLAPETSRTPSR